MIQVLHISAECYPAAKTGGLGDVVGSVPKYMTRAGVLSAAILPKYYLKWIVGREWVTVYAGSVWNNWREWRFSVQQEKGNTQGYPMFVVDIPGLYDRPGIYNDPSGAPYGDEVLRYIVFQQAVLEWLLSFPWHDRPRVLHCHDHHTGLIPWMMKYCPHYHDLAPIPTVFTIHNGQYQGMFSWQNNQLLPPYEANAKWILDWNGIVNPMAAAIKTAWAVTTVSQSYLYELHDSSLGLEALFRQEWSKQYGIVNGIDAQVWDPATDPMIQSRLNEEHSDRRTAIHSFKERNKKVLCEWFGFPYDAPLISFIGRMVGEKGVDVLPDTYKRFIHAGGRASFLVLGTGEAWTQNQFRTMAHRYLGRFNAVIDYNEALSHQIYAGSDFLIMPSRVEPCGLNQMYAMRYGAIPIVRSVGGLKDTVPDIGEPDGNGRGIRFDQFSIEDVYHAIYRATSMYHNNPGIIDGLRERIMALDFSWENTIERYFNVYRRVGAAIEPAFIISEAEVEEKPVEVSPPTTKKSQKQAVKENLPATAQTKEETPAAEPTRTGQEVQVKEETPAAKATRAGKKAQTKEETPAAKATRAGQEVMVQEKKEKKSAAQIPSEKKTGSKKINKEVLPETSSLPKQAAGKKSPAKK